MLVICVCEYCLMFVKYKHFFLFINKQKSEILLMYVRGYINTFASQHEYSKGIFIVIFDFCDK